MTAFQILVSTTAGSWDTAGIEEAYSGDSAKEKAYLKNPEASILEIVTVPLRSWKPTPIRAEPQPQKVILGKPLASPEPVQEQESA